MEKKNSEPYFEVLSKGPFEGLCVVYPNGTNLMKVGIKDFTGKNNVCLEAKEIAAAVSGFTGIYEKLDPLAEYLFDELGFLPKTPKGDKWRGKFLKLCTQFYEKSLELAAEYKKESSAFKQEVKAAIKEMNAKMAAYEKGTAKPTKAKAKAQTKKAKPASTKSHAKAKAKK